MKLPLALVLLASLSAPVGATAPRCDNTALMKSLGKLRGSDTLRVVVAPDEVRVELVHGASRDVALRVTCDAIELPVADQVERPSKGASTRVVAGITLARTAKGAISLGFPAGLLDPIEVEVLLLDDDSISIARGDKVYFAYATRGDGTIVETEGIGNGCGCERTTAPDGTVSTRRLRR